MMIIGVDYHASFQAIAFLIEETGECGQQELNHNDGQADKFYRDLKQRGICVRRHGGYRIFTPVRAATGSRSEGTLKPYLVLDKPVEVEQHVELTTTSPFPRLSKGFDRKQARTN
jgi:hypothetical protein